MTHSLSTWDHQSRIRKEAAVHNLPDPRAVPGSARVTPDGWEAVGTDFPDGALRTEPDEPHTPALSPQTVFTWLWAPSCPTHPQAWRVWCHPELVVPAQKLTNTPL